jgi:hypothetical protein
MGDYVIYFFGSIRGEEANMEVFRGLIDHLKKYGEVIDEHFFQHGLDDVGIVERDFRNIARANVLVGEVTAASTGSGIEIGTVLERNRLRGKKKHRPILCLYRTPEEETSALVTGMIRKGYRAKKYDKMEGAYRHIDDFFETLKD